MEWMQTRLDCMQQERGRMTVEKKANNTKLAKKKESVLSELEKLRTLNRAHRKLMVEIWPHLTTLARVRTVRCRTVCCLCTLCLPIYTNVSITSNELPSLL